MEATLYGLISLLTDIDRASYEAYRQISNIRRSESQNLNVSPLVLQLSLPNLSIYWSHVLSLKMKI